MLGETEPVVSEKDLAAPLFSAAEMNFIFEG